MIHEYITLGITSIEQAKWTNPINKRYIINKPTGALWACRYTPNDNYVSDWERWCDQENFGVDRLANGILFNLKNNARIYTIDSLDDLKHLTERYLLSLPDDDVLLSLNKLSKCLDFVKIKTDYDVIELTENGQWETRYSHPYSLYGWDVASILILNFDVIDIDTQKSYQKK